MQGFTEKDKLEPHLKRHASPQEMTNSLAALLKEPSPTENHQQQQPENLAQTTTVPSSQSLKLKKFHFERSILHVLKKFPSMFL